MLRDRLERVRQRIQHACQRSGRQPSAVTLIGVTKGVGPDAIREAVALGLTDLGENRVQEAREKQAVLGSRFEVQGGPLEPVRWHLIGHLQRNKAKPAVELFDLIHSADSIELIEDLERHAATPVQGSRFKVQGKDVEGNGTRIGVLVQVNVSGETSKFGCRLEEALALCRLMTQQPSLHLRGLMTIAPFVADPQAARPHFRALRLLRDAIAATLHLDPRTLNLSMGMSQDFEVAVEEGADFIRVGTAIFGART